MYLTSVETHKARKQHRCDWCGQAIEPATDYKRYRFFDGADAGTVKLHPECHDASCDAAHEEGGYLEWTPGENERPAPYIQNVVNAL